MSNFSILANAAREYEAKMFLRLALFVLTVGIGGDGVTC